MNPSARISRPPCLVRRGHARDGEALLLEVLQVDQHADADDRVVVRAEMLRVEHVVVDEAVVRLPKGLARALDHVLGVVERVDVADEGAEALGREAVAAPDLEDPRAGLEVAADVVVLDLALEDVHQVDLDVVRRRRRRARSSAGRWRT